MQIVLRPYQQEAVSALRHQYTHGKKSPMLVAPTGSGKTCIFSYIAEQASLKGNSVFVLVHRQELLLQSSRQLSQLGLPHGRVAPGHTMTRDKIQVASVQTLVRRLDLYKEPDLIIIDECHHATAGSWRKIISAYPNAKLLGVTATPCRLDGNGLGVHAGGVFDALVYGPTLRELIDAGYLTQPIVYAPPTSVDLEGVKIQAGDYEKGELEKRMDKPIITGSAVEHYKRLCNGVPAIAFCSSVAHAQHVSEQFNVNGYASLSIDGTMGDVERKNAIELLGQGKINVLTACDIVSEGTDIPVVGAAILLRPTTSEGLFLQQVGRALRTYPGKENTIILDHVGNCLRHGLPDQDRTWTLDGEKKKRKKKGDVDDVKVKQCPICYFVHTPGPKCPACGHTYVAKAQEIEEAEGELKQLTDAKVFEKKRMIARAQTLEELVAVGAELGYKPGWAWQVWAARRNKHAGRAITTPAKG